MSMIWGGTLNSVLSDITSTIVKCNVANRYGEKNYSTKAYPSPALNDREKDILFRAASMAEFDVWENTEITKDMEKALENDANNGKLKTNWTFTFTEGNERAVIDKNNNTLVIGLQNFRLSANYSYVVQKVQNLIDDIICTYGYINIRCVGQGFVGDRGTSLSLSKSFNGFSNGTKCNYLPFDCPKKYSRQSRILKESHQKIEYITLKNDYYRHNYADNVNNKNIEDIQKTNYMNGPIANYNRTQLIKRYYSRLPQATLQENNHNEAVDQSILNQLITMLHTFNDIGKIETEMYDVEVLDRMEKCIVKSRHGFTISRKKQLNNLKRYYLDDRSSSYTIYYDPKTMLPLLPYVTDAQDFGNISIDETTGQVSDIVDDEGNSIDKFKIKVGTIYYKWTRSVKYKSNDDTGILGRSFVIDADTFPDYYKIVGETYIRNRKTGKDQRYQFVINRAQVSADTNITLEAEGDPTTFSMQIDVLTPPNDVMMELKQYDVEEDNINGGFSVVPQKSEYTYTSAWKEPENMEAPRNDEVY